MAKYMVFDTQREVSEANGRWLFARSQEPVYDTRKGVPIDPQITSAWDYGRIMIDGRIACAVPKKWASDFGGVELELDDTEFPSNPAEV